MRDWRDVVSSIAPQLKTGVRVHVNIEGKGIITRMLQSSDQIDEDFVKRILPGFDGKNFVGQLFSGASTRVLTLLRKDSVNFVDNFWTSSVKIHSVSLGNFISNEELGLIPTPYPLEDKMSELAYFSALNIFNPGKSIEFFGAEEFEKNKRRYEHAKNFFHQGRYALIVLFCSVAFNLICYLTLREKVAELQLTATSREISLKEDQKNRNSLLKAQVLYSKLGWPSNVLPLYYADQIALSRREPIQLTFLEIGTEDRTVSGNERKVGFDQTKIRISGKAKSVSALGIWLAELRTRAWIRDIINQKYNQGKLTEEGSFEFEILI